jgi:hypothetical protein
VSPGIRRSRQASFVAQQRAAAGLVHPDPEPEVLERLPPSRMPRFIVAGPAMRHEDVQGVVLELDSELKVIRLRVDPVRSPFISVELDVDQRRDRALGGIGGYVGTPAGAGASEPDCR